LFFTGRFFGKFAVKCLLKIPTHLANVAALPWETLMSTKQAINDKNYKVVKLHILGVVGLLIKK